MVGILITPLLVRGLGIELFGTWGIIQRSVAYLGLADLRSMETLKFRLALDQSNEDIEARRRAIGTALMTWLYSLPVGILGSAALVYGLPILVGGGSVSHPVRLGMAIAAIGVLVDRASSLPQSVLRGLNEDYRAMGLDTLAILLGGVLTAAALFSDLGLPGVAGAGLVGVIAFNGTRFYIAKRTFRWFGISRPLRDEIRAFLTLSGWRLFGELATLLMASIDVILIGVLIGPAPAAIYLTTQAVLRFAMGPITEIIGSGGPALTMLCGAKQWDRVRALRQEQHLLGIGLGTIVGASTLALNASFLQLWLGEKFYGGPVLTLLFVVVFFQTILASTDTLIADAVLEYRARTVISLIAGGGLIAAGFFLIDWLGLEGAALSVVIARLIVLVFLPRLIGRKIGTKTRALISPLLRSLVVTAIGFVAAARLATVIRADSWIEFFLALGGSVVAMALTWWFVALRRLERRQVRTRLAVAVSRRETPTS